jgi:hypothetical protein
MINLRYHIVSLVAVFLALGMGIVMGTTVVDRVTVDALNNRLNDVQSAVNDMRAENRRLGDQVRVGRDFAEQTRDHLVDGELRGVPVLIVAVSGVDRKPVDALRQTLVSAGATVEGTLWFNPKMRLDSEGDVRALAEALDLPAPQNTGPAVRDALRNTALDRIAGSREGGGDNGAVSALIAAGFLGYEAPIAASTSVPAPAIGSIPTAGTRYIVVAGAGAAVADHLVAIPFSNTLARSPGRLVAAEAGVETPGGRSVFVGTLRGDSALATRLSTVDNLESPMGQAAAVLAVRDLATPRFGHFGVGPGAQRLVPEAPAGSPAA